MYKRQGSGHGRQVRTFRYPEYVTKKEILRRTLLYQTTWHSRQNRFDINYFVSVNCSFQLEIGSLFLTVGVGAVEKVDSYERRGRESGPFFLRFQIWPPCLILSNRINTVGLFPISQ